MSNRKDPAQLTQTEQNYVSSMQAISDQQMQVSLVNAQSLATAQEAQSTAATQTQIAQGWISNQEKTAEGFSKLTMDEKGQISSMVA